MTQLKLAGESGALDNINASQAQFRQQIAALNDLMRQIAGNAVVAAGSTTMVDPLSAPFTLYVNPYTGSDKFVGGSYNDFEATGTDEEIIAAKLKRLELQRLECGYTPHRPFKTINRAVIEAAIITSKDWYTYTDPKAHVDCVSIILSPGVHTVYNDPGSSSTSLASWGTSKTPTTAELIAFNPATVGGVLLPRGCSLCGPDLRKTTLRPNWVPGAADEATDYNNRRGMLKITGTGYFFGFTVMDKVGLTSSHHLLDAFHFASKAELDAFYTKTLAAVGSGADLATALTVTRGTEYKIVGPIVAGETPTAAWDTTASASPYIFNCSIRSDYGLGGAFMDGAKVEGLKSMVCANFTGVSLQKDMTCWQRYSAGAWTTTDYSQYISASPNDIRMNPARLSRHISAINDAFIQEVSVFAIGQGVHHFTDLGGEITVTNSNSSFGGCAALSRGYKTFAFPQDKSWTVARIKTALDLSTKTGNVQRIELGTISAIASGKITLLEPLAADANSSTVPAVLLQQGYSLAGSTLIWIENPLGDDWKATLTSSAWTSTTTTTRREINITGLDAGALDLFFAQDSTTPVTAAIGKRVYIRRLVDTRTPEERQVSLILQNTNAVSRIPERNFVVQTTPGGSISSVISTAATNTLSIINAGKSTVSGLSGSVAEITIRRSAPSRPYSGSNTYYAAGTVVRHNGKHYLAKSTHTATTANPDPAFWEEAFVHMPDAYDAEDSAANEKPILVIDTDTDASPASTTLGINWTNVYAGNLFRSATDYQGVLRFLQILGFTDNNAHAALLPRAEANRLLDPSSASVFPNQPSGGVASARGNWGLEFRRPSVLRLYGHAWEWAGFLNYSKAIPAAQKTLSPQNKFTYYYTNQNGGRVVPQGSNEDGFNVTPRGLEDVETGTTLSVENIGNSSIQQAQITRFETLTVKNLTVENSGSLSFGSSSQLNDSSNSLVAQTTKTGIGKLARASSLALLPGSATYPTLSGTGAALDTSLNSNIRTNPEDGLITLAALNHWRSQQGLVSAISANVIIYVDAASTRNISSTATPNSFSTAFRTVAEAASYANTLLSGSDQTALIRIAPGLYDPFSTWNCNVRFEAFDKATNTRLWTDTNGSSSTPNTYFNGYDDGGIGFNGSGYNITSAAEASGTKQPGVNFWAYRLELFDTSNTDQNFTVVSQARTMTFNRSVEFRGGFNFLGLAETIRRAAQNHPNVPRATFLQGVTITGANWTTLASENLTTNVDRLLLFMRQAAPWTVNKTFEGVTGSPLLRIQNRLTDISVIRDCVFGPTIPSRKELKSSQRDPMISVTGNCQLEMSNIYIRGFTRISTNGMGGSVGDSTWAALPLSDATPRTYSTITYAAPWEWRQTHHTFIGTPEDSLDSITIKQLGNSVAVLVQPGNSASRTYFKQAYTGGERFLPNCIHLLNNNGQEATTAQNDGPFFDFFIHAKIGISISSAWPQLNTSSASGSTGIYSGFVGVFGSAGTHTVTGTTTAIPTLTRGILLGNYGSRDPELGFTLVTTTTLPRKSSGSPSVTYFSIFQKAGFSNADRTNGLPTFNPASTTSGQAPNGDNVVISTGDTDAFSQLNIGLRSYLRGASQEKCTFIPQSTIA